MPGKYGNQSYLRTHGGILSQYSDIFPWRGVPVGVVVSLLGTLVTIAISLVVLSGVYGTAVPKLVLLQFLVSSEEPCHGNGNFKVSFIKSIPQNLVKSEAQQFD